MKASRFVACASLLAGFTAIAHAQQPPRPVDPARAARLVYEQAGPDGLRLYCYSSSCVYDGQWNEATMIARGLVLDVEKQMVVATPFPKFFNGRPVVLLLAKQLEGSLLMLAVTACSSGLAASSATLA